MPSTTSSTAAVAASPVISLTAVFRFFAYVIPFLILAFAYRRCAMTFPTHSDFCNFMLQADAVVHGNPLFRHWYLTTVSYYTTDDLFFSLGAAIRGFNPILLHEVPAVAFTIIVGLSLWLAANPHRGNRRAWLAAIGVAFALVGVPNNTLAFHFLTGTLHVGMMMPILIALLAIDMPESALGSISPWRLALCFGALTSAIIADTMALYLAIGPILLVTAVEIRLESNANRRRSSLSIGLAAIASVIAAKIFFHVMTAVGGFKLPDMYSNHVAFIPYEQIGTNVSNSVQSLQIIYGADFWGRILSAGTLFVALHLIGALVVSYALACGIFVWYSGTARQIDADSGSKIDRISAVLVIGMAMNLASYTFSNLQIGLQTTRYLAPFAIMGAIVAARWLIHSSRYRKQILCAVGVYGLISAVSFFREVRQPRMPLDGPPARLGVWLRDHGMADAYGEYWSSSAVTVLSHKAALVRPIMEVGGKMAPYLCSVDERWYQTPVHCLVVGPQNAENVNLKTAAADFGQPDRLDTIEGYTVLWYNKDLTPLLGRSPYQVP